MTIPIRFSATYQRSPRINRLRARAMARDVNENLGWRRTYLYLEGWMGAAGQPLPLRNAAALATVIERMPVRLRDEECIIGEHDCTWAQPNFQAAMPADFLDKLLSTLETDEQAHLREWMKAAPFDWFTLAPIAPQPDEYRRAQEHGAIVVWGTDLNHSIRAYEKVLRLGFAGLKAEVETALAALPRTDPDSAQRRANYLAWQRLCDAAMTLSARHAAAAREQAAACDDPVRRAELDEIAAICDRVPAHPARTFREAVQSLWFAHMITAWEDGINANGIGRFDQFMWPYLQADLDAGRITWEEAEELLAALWVKLYLAYDVQQMMIGGQTVDGRDAVNPLSYLVLDVTEGMDFVRCLSARLHRDSPRAFVERCVDLVAKGGGIPFFFNDEALIPALTGKGIPLTDARGYAAIGCIEITIPGKANPHAVSNWINLPKCLELALNDGRDLLDNVQVGLRTGTLADCRSMDDVLRAYETQLRYFAEWAVYGSNAAELAHRSQYRLPYLSLLTDDCVARGLDIIEGGARYNYHSSAAMGLPNAADSLAALELGIFSDGKAAPAEMLEALRANYAGREDLRLYLRNRLPKYGNDESVPDGYAAKLAQQYCDLLASYRTVGGGTFFAHLFTFTLMIPYGKLTGASPDGRLAGEPLAYSVSPAQGRDREGLTAVVQSLSRIPHHLAAASSSAILEAEPTLLLGDGKRAFTDLLITAIAQGVGQLQFNVVSAETLRKAQRKPDEHRNLCVRVSGFSQQFLLLDAEMQEHIIARTKHAR